MADSLGKAQLGLLGGARVVADELKRLRDIAGETVHLAGRNGSSMVYI